MKTILIVGGGSNQVPLVEAARARGLRVVVSDMYENPPCRAVADAFFQIDTVNREETLRLAKELGIDAVQTDQTDVAVPTVAFVAEEMKLPGIGFGTALRCTNKQVMRADIVSNEVVQVPKAVYFPTPREAVEGLKNESPDRFVIKPINSQGSRGVSRLSHDLAATKELIEVAYREGRMKGLLLEEFVEGDEYSVEAFVVAGKVHNLVATKKFHYPSNPCIDFRNTFLGDIPASVERALFDANTSVIQQVGLKNGSTHTELMVKDSKVFLIEVAARGGGGNISGKIVPYLTGFNPSAALIALALGERPEVLVGNYREKFAVMRFLDLPAGVVKKIDVDTREASAALHFELNLNPGDVIREVRSSRDRPGYFVVAGSTRKAALEAERRMNEAIKVEYE